jgi:HD-GYP domain-containing protein (c-di-GMP phosphodiesterase class II)
MAEIVHTKRRAGKDTEVNEIKFQEYGQKIYNQLMIIFRSLNFLDFANRTMQNYLAELIAAVNGFIAECEPDVNFRFIEELAFIGEKLIKVDANAYKKGEPSRKIFHDLQIGEIRFLGTIGDKDVLDFFVDVQKSIKAKDSGEILHQGTHPRITIKKMYRVDFGSVEQESEEEVDIFQMYTLMLLLVKDFLKKLREGSTAPPKHLKRIIQQIVDESEGLENRWIGITFLPNYKRELYCQLVNNSILAMFLARRLKLSNYDVAELGFAAIFFDIGKDFINPDILKKRKELTVEQVLELRQIPLHSLRVLLRYKSFNESWITRFVTAFESQMNVKGETRENFISYPFQTQPILFSRIISVVALFNELTTPHEEGDEGLLPDEAIRVILEKKGKSIDDLIARIFVNMIGVYPIGTTVLLNTGEKGIVYDVPRGLKDYTRPIVKLVQDPSGNPIAEQVVNLMEVVGGKYRRTIEETIAAKDLNINTPHFFLS